MPKFKAPKHTSSVTTSIGNVYPVEDGQIEIAEDAHQADFDSLRAIGCVEAAEPAPSAAEPPAKPAAPAKS